MKLNELSSDKECVTGLLYGNSKTGKTALIGTAGNDSVIITPAQGMATLQSKWFKEKYPNFNPEIEIVDEKPLPDAALGFDKIRELTTHYLNDPNIRTIIVDDMTNVRRMALNKGLELNKKTERSKTLDKMNTIKADMIIREMNDITVEMSLIESYLKQGCMYAKEAKKHFFVTAHERIQFRKPDKIGDQPTVLKRMPGFSGQTFPDDVTQYFDLIWKTHIQGSNPVYYQWRTDGASDIVAGTRWAGIFPTIIERNTTLEEIIKCIQTDTKFKEKL